MSGARVRKVAGFGVAAGLLAASYPVLLRNRCLNWGATPDEVARTIPGDELNPDADEVTTRAITIAAQPDCTWPWLVQMGSGRGGAYSYDWIENLFGLNMHSASNRGPPGRCRPAAACGDSGLTQSCGAITPRQSAPRVGSQ